MKKSTSPQNIIPPIIADEHSHNNYQLGTATFTPYDNLPFNNLKEHRDFSKEYPSNQIPTSNISSVVLEGLDQGVAKLVALKQAEYTNLAYRYKNIHYMLVMIGSVFGIITPFIIPYFPVLAQITSIIVVFVISLEHIFKPKEKWTLYSKATDLIQLQLFKITGAYKNNKELINTIINTEAQILDTVPDLNEVLKQVKNSRVPNKNT